MLMNMMMMIRQLSVVRGVCIVVVIGVGVVVVMCGVVIVVDGVVVIVVAGIIIGVVIVGVAVVSGRWGSLNLRLGRS